MNNNNITISSGNVFEDLDLESSQEHLAKAQLAVIIQTTIESLALSQSKAAEIMNLDQPKVSKIMRGQLKDFSTDRLLNCVVLLGCDVKIVVQKGKSVGAGKFEIAYS